MNNGGIGIHIEANSPGYSRDDAVRIAKNYNASIATVVNDHILCHTFYDMGMEVIHRINRNGLLDDNQDQYRTTRLYIQTAHTECPQPGIFINWNNEPAHNPHRLLTEGLVAIDEAVKLNRTLAMLGFSYGNPEQEVHDILDPLYRRMAETGMIYCCHEGTDFDHPTVESCYPDLIGRFLPIQRKYGLRVIVTEFAASFDAHNGYRTWNSKFAEVTEETQRDIYSPNGVKMTPFTAKPWHNGFDYGDDLALQSSWKLTNERYPIMAQHNWGMQRKGTASSTANINIRPQPDEKSTPVLGTLRNGDSVEYWDNPYQSITGAKYKWWKVIYGGQEAYVAEVANLKFAPIALDEGRFYTEDQINTMRDLLDAVAVVLDEGVPSDSGGSF